ncbi:restriction endonuclease subunit S [Pantoea brenneri]|uniref:restriction endonuclease subunit S n=1 Tax=Pantoea brenneri TaxID=472694 RepID=UPI00210A1FB7|nr:restriction endonuclease subunit S [Pantoea brenneri]MCQ5470972.1 restriction endonuclease subunit S [Pantoea brenneri]
MSELSYLEKLLDGVVVEWLPIGDIAEIYGGLTGKTKADFEKGNAKYISYKSIFGCLDIKNIPTDCVDVREGERQHNVRYGDVLFTGSSEIAEEAGISSAVTSHFDEPVYLNSFSFGVRFRDEIKIKPEFSKYLFRTSMMRTEIARTASGVTRFNISKARFKKILIPVICPNNPEKSLAIQSEIVRILDSFTALTAELTAELTARKKQYNYYRDQLLSFEEGEVEWKTLGEVARIQRGASPRPIAQYMTEDNDGTPWIKIGDTSLGSKYIDSTAQKVTSAGAKKSRILNPGDFVISNSMSFGRPYILRITGAIHDGWASISDFSKRLDSDYLYHYLSSQRVQNYWGIKINSGSVSNLNADIIKTLPIPLPDTRKQKQIAMLLDKFDTLTSSITEGLPREIEMRQKQYEYYRDLLFSFPKLDAVS